MSTPYDILISYSSADDIPSGDNGIGWVSNFANFLEARLSELTGKSPKILLADENTSVNDFPTQAKVFLPVVSANFVNSKSLGNFTSVLETIEGSGEESSLSTVRVFKVVLDPIKDKKSYGNLNSLVGYDFFEVESQSGAIQVYSHQNLHRISYFIHLEDLAFDIYSLLRNWGNKKAQGESEYIFLATTGKDLPEERNIIKRELQRYGYEVLPYRTLSNIDVSGGVEKVLGKILAKSRMSIHMIGSDFGTESPVSGKSMQELQNELAADYCEKQHIPRVIWFPPKLKINDKRQQKFVDHLRQDADAIRGAEMYQFPIEHLKTVIHEKLKLLNQKDNLSESDANATGDKKRIYLISELREAEICNPMIELLEKQNLEVLQTNYVDDQYKMRSRHQKNLVNCDALLIFYGNASPLWLRMKLQDIRKSAGFGRENPIALKAIYFNGPTPDLKAIGIDNDIEIIKDDGSLNSKSMTGFLNQLNQLKGGS